MSMYQSNPSTDFVVTTMSDVDTSDPQDATEAYIQRFLADLEQAPPEVQLAVIGRLLSGLAAKLPSSLAAKAIAAAREKPAGAKPKGAGGKGRGSKKAEGEEFARIDSQLALLPDSTDPILAWQHFGGSAQTLREVLNYEPTGALEAMLRHDRMPPGPKPRGKSRQALVDAIVQRLAAYYQSSDMS